MQIVINVGEEGRPTAQVLGAAATGEPVAYTAAAEEAALDAGAGPAEGEELEAESAIAAAAREREAVDGGPAPAELEETVEPMEAAPPAEAEAPEEAGPAPTVSDIFPTEPGPPRLRPVD